MVDGVHAMKLTSAGVKNLNKPDRYNASAGLYLFVGPTSSGIAEPGGADAKVIRLS